MGTELRSHLPHTSNVRPLHATPLPVTMLAQKWRFTNQFSRRVQSASEQRVLEFRRPPSGFRYFKTRKTLLFKSSTVTFKKNDVGILRF